MQHFFSFVINVATRTWCSFNHKTLLLVISTFLVLSSEIQAQTLAWARSIGGTSGDVSRSMVTDASGNVYVVGQFQGMVDFDPGSGTTNLTSNGNEDVFFAKYDKLGNLVWVKQIGGTAQDVVEGIALDGSNNIYISGAFQNTVDFDPNAGTQNLMSAGNADLYLAKYNNNGEYQWAFNLGTAAGSERGLEVEVDQNSNVVLTGSFSGTVDFDPSTTNTADVTAVGDRFVAQYDSNGAYKWAIAIPGTLRNTFDHLALDANGNIYLVGDFTGIEDFDPSVNSANLTSNGDRDVFIAKYNSSGTYQWAKNIGGTSRDVGQAIALNNSNEIAITGAFQGIADFDPGTGTANLTSNGGQDIFIAKYDNSGNYQWANGIGGTGTDQGNAIRINASNQILLAGAFSGANIDFDPGTGTANLSSNGGTDLFAARFANDGSYVSAFGIGGTVSQELIDASFSDTGTIILLGNFSSMVDFDPGSGTTNLTADAFGDVFFAKYGLPEINVKAGTVNLASGSTRDFDNVNIGSSSADVTFTIENLGATDLTLNGTAGSLVALSGTNAADFTVTQTSVTSPIAAESNATFTVSFTPSAAGNRSAVLTIMNNDANEGTYTINLTGTGTAPEINVKAGANNVASGGTYDFGSVQSGQSSADVIFTIENTGNGMLALTGTAGSLVVLGGTNAADFAVTQTNVTSPVAANGNVTFTVKYTASATVGAASATLTITSNDSDESSYTINLTGASTSSVTSLPNTLTTGKLKIGPNPVTDQVKVMVSGQASTDVSYQIVDLQGRLVSTGKGTAQNGALILNLSQLGKGNYVVIFNIGNQIVSRRLQKQ